MVVQNIQIMHHQCLHTSTVTRPEQMDFSQIPKSAICQSVSQQH